MGKTPCVLCWYRRIRMLPLVLVLVVVLVVVVLGLGLFALDAQMRGLKVDRTPGFFVNGTPLREFGEAALKALVEQEIKKVAAP